MGPKYRGPRVQSLTRGPAADETKTHILTVAWPAAAPNVRSSPLGANTVCKSRNSFADTLFTQGLMALMSPTIWCVRAQSVREFVTEFSGGVAQAVCPCMWVVVWLTAAKLHSYHPGHF